MNKKFQNLLILLMAVYALLVIVININFHTMRINTSNWIEFVLAGLFFVLLFQFWKMVERDTQMQVMKASITDSLSGLYTAQHFFRTLEAEIDRSKRRSYNLSAMLVDIDYFHRYNEKHGLKNGDKVLRYIGDVIVESTRKYDSGFRFGNDEFALVLPETDRVQARVISERLREEFVQSYGSELGLSIGIATFDDQEDGVDRMLRKAEEAMEDARRGGGNRTRSYIERGQL